MHLWEAKEQIAQTIGAPVTIVDHQRMELGVYVLIVYHDSDVVEINGNKILRTWRVCAFVGDTKKGDFIIDSKWLTEKEAKNL